MYFKLIYVLVVAISLFPVAFGQNAGKKESEFDAIWGTTMKQEDFDGMPLPENSNLINNTRIIPAIVNIKQRYDVPHMLPLEKIKSKPGKADDIVEQIMGASFTSGGTLISMGILSLVVMASKALLVAFGAILLTLLSTGWIGGTQQKHGSASTVYEVITKPQISHGYGYSSEMRHEPYSPSSSPSSVPEYGYRHR